MREEDAYDAAAQEHRLRPLVRLRSGKSSTSPPSPHRDSWAGHPHWVFYDALQMLGSVSVRFVRSSLAAAAWFVPFFCLAHWLRLTRLRKALHGLLPHQVARLYFALVDLALGSLRFKGDILFVSAQVFISPVGLVDAVMTAMR